MNNNDIIRRIRYALTLNDQKMLEVFRLSGYEIDLNYLNILVRKEDELGFVECSDNVLDYFLDGLITYKRGPKNPDQSYIPEILTNNIILKKIKIALELKDDDIISMMKLAGIEVSKSEISALFRNKDHRNYKICGDQFLRNFLNGLTQKLRR